MSEGLSSGEGRGAGPAAEQTYTFFVRLGGLRRDEIRRFSAAENLEFVINKLVNFDDARLESITPEDVVVYLAEEDGEPQTDISPIDQQAPLGVMPFRHFVLTTRIPHSSESSLARSDSPPARGYWCCCRRALPSALTTPLTRP